MIKIHWLMCFPRRLGVFWYTILVVLSLLFLLFTRDIALSSTMIQNREFIQTQYTIQAVELIKWGALFIAMAVVLLGFVMEQYDGLMLYYMSRRKAIITKVLLVDGIVVVWVVLAFAILLIIGRWFGNIYYTVPQANSLLLQLIVFSLLYQHWMIFLYVVGRHIVMVLSVLFLYVISMSNLDYFVNKADISFQVELFQLLFPDITIYNNYQIEMYYSIMWYFVVIIVLFYRIYWRFKESDITK